MMGKIIGVGLTGLTQFIIWMILGAILVTGLKAAFFPELNQTPTEQVVGSDLFDQGGNAQSLLQEDADSLANFEMDTAQEVFASLKAINAGVMIGSFLFFFVFGYLLYAAMFAVIGSAVDNETDTQQLIWPVILVHALANFASFIDQESIVQTDAPGQADLIRWLVYVVIFAVYGTWMLRRIDRPAASRPRPHPKA